MVKRFGGVTAVDDLSLDIGAGEFFALLGPSGCGKTTLLRMLAGFETPDAGAIQLDGEDIAQVPPHQRPVNMMFQNYALFPHLTVARQHRVRPEARGLAERRYRGARRGDARAGAARGLEQRRPINCPAASASAWRWRARWRGGRRCCCSTSRWRRSTRSCAKSTQAELMEVQRRLGMTFIIVTHDQEEAMTVADRIGVMDKATRAGRDAARTL